MFFKLWKLLKLAALDWIEDDCSRWGAALAFYSILSLAPVLVITVAIVGAVYGEAAARGELVGRMQELAGKEGAGVIEQVLANARQPEAGSLAAALSVVLLLYGAGSVFAQLRAALNHVWEVATPTKQGIAGYLRGKLIAVAMVLCVGALLLASLVLSTAIQVAQQQFDHAIPSVAGTGYLLDAVVSFVVLTGMFALLYRYVPDVHVAWAEVWVGAVIAALLFTLGKSLLGVYLGRSGLASTYGAAGSFVLLIVWIYYSAQIMLFGAELTQVYAQEFGQGLSERDPSRHPRNQDQASSTATNARAT